MNNLFLAPHHDDETLFGAYTLLAVPDIIVCVCFSPVSRKEAVVRRLETRKALEVLGISNYRFYGGVTEKDPDPVQRLSGWFSDLCDEYEPELVFAPSLEKSGGNPDHNIVWHTSKEIFGSKVINYMTYSYPAGRTISGKRAHREDGWMEKKREAMMCYSSQIANPLTSSHFLNPDMEEYYG